jgi:ketosteroid isomerase-like protein
MRKNFAFAMLTFTLLSVSALAATPAEDVLAAVKNYRQALVKKDYAVLENTWSADYRFVNGHGALLTKADRLAELKSGHTSVGSITHEEEPTITVHGDLAIVLSNVTLVGKYSGREVSGKYRSLHVWMRTDGRWQLVFNQLTEIK